MTSTSLRVAPITGVIGAEIEGVDLSKSLDDETFEEIHAALVEHLVLFFRDQDLTLEQQVAFTRRFGPACPTPLRRDDVRSSRRNRDHQGTR